MNSDYRTQSCLLSFDTMIGDFLLNPTLLRLFTGSLHLILLFTTIVSWVCKKIMRNGSVSRQGNVNRATFSYYRPILCFSFGISVLNLGLCVFYCFVWKSEDWSDGKIVTLLDLGVRGVAWFNLSLFLRNQIPSSYGKRYPFLLRMWCALFVLVSCYCLGVDIFYYRKYGTLLNLFWASDICSMLMGSFLCCFGFLGKLEVEDDHLQEPLLNESTTNEEEPEKVLRGDETVTPFANANIFSILFFSWLSPLISLGYKKTLDLEDIPQVSSSDTVRATFPVLDETLETSRLENNKITKIMIAKALVLVTWREIVISALCTVGFTVGSYVGPYLIDNLVQYLNGHQSFHNKGTVLVSTFVIAKILECLTRRLNALKVQQAAYKARSALITKIYNKGFNLSCESKRTNTTGEIINIMAVDVERINGLFWYVHDPWTIVLEVALALLILYKNLGFASLVALVATVLVMLANIPLGKLEENFQCKLMTSKDKRMKATTEILSNMRILKFQAWEMKFLSKILHLRNVEASWLRKYLYTSALSTFLFWGAPIFVSVVTFGACILMGIPLESGKILSAIATFNILQVPIYNLPNLVSVAVQAKVSLDRVASFLSLDDLVQDVEKLPFSNTNTAVEIINGNFVWDASSPSAILKNINIKVSPGIKVAICGTVGSGKSSLLSCILGEMQKLSGVVRVGGSKAYVAQSPWIRSGTIEENILFCKEMDRERYDRVIDACSLKKDLEILAFGDQTIIGEKGINLSGGQKQRIQIARALYQDADIYLFDDPFSAVDAHTGTHLFNECILGHLDSKTVIYVTHQMDFLPAADIILVMKDGEIEQTGKYEDILNSGSDFMKLFGAHKEALSVIESSQVSEPVNGEGSRHAYAEKALEKQETGNDKNDNVDDCGGKKGQLVQEEERGKGNVGFLVYWRYITTAYGGLLVPFILLAQISFEMLQIGSNYWMAWASPVSEDVEPHVDGSTLLLVYVALAVGSSFCVLSRTMLLATASYKTAQIFFEKMHLCIFRAPMSFFDSTPSGRILNRASSDQATVDLTISPLLGTALFCAVELIGIVVVVSQVTWKLFIIFIPVVALSILLQQYYIPSARELARICSLCRSPVIQHFSETLAGSSTIRSFDQESKFRDRCMKLIDDYTRPRFHSSAAMEWLSIRLDMFCLATFAFALAFLISLPVGFVDPSIAGLAVTYGLNLNTLQSYLVWILCTLETRIIAVERILQYSSVTSEPPLVVESNRPQIHWPTSGEVNIQDLQVRYAPHMPLVLRGITCTFFGGKKTGIVGRTGSGKSTLIQTLFRMVEPANGRILIDGIDISSIGLHDLRSKLSIIPQEPTMFQGTVRSNLDPLEEYTDEQIWEALDKCQLGEKVRKAEGKLDSPVSENGENWSVGQRQLVCLGRVLLKKSKILVLDEATASVDTATDNLIQQTLKQHFSDSTVIAIAHRITSVLDSSMVLLLEQGAVEEYDPPEKLLEDKSSLFAKLVAEYSMRSSPSMEKLEING